MELVHECSLEHLRMGTLRLKYDTETEDEGKHKRVKMESTAGTKKNNSRQGYIAVTK